MALKLIDKENTRKIFKNPGSTIRLYVVGDFKLRINPDLILRILESYGVDAGGDKIHKIIFNDNKEFYVNDAGLAQILS